MTPASLRRRIGIRATALAMVVGLTLAASASAADSPNGDSAGAWPISWRAYTLSGGTLVRDVIGDVGCGSGYCDVSSGGSGSSSSVYFTSDGTSAFFRIRLRADPRDASHGGFHSTAYVLQIAVNGTAVVAVGLNGKSAHRDFVYVANADGTAYTEVYAHPFNSSGGQRSAGARGLPDGTGHYFVDWQVPLSRITARSGGKVTGSTPVQLFFGTSQSANLSVINKDYMVGNGVSFGGGATVTLVPQPAAPTTASSPPATPPGTPPVPGSGPTTAPSGGLPLLPNTRMAADIDSPLTTSLVVAGLVLGLAGWRRLRRTSRR